MNKLRSRQVHSCIQDHTATKKQSWDPDTNGPHTHQLLQNPMKRTRDSNWWGDNSANQRLTMPVTRWSGICSPPCSVSKPLLLVDRRWFPLAVGFGGSGGTVPLSTYSSWDLGWVCGPGLANTCTLFNSPQWLPQGWAFTPSWSKEYEHLNFYWQHKKKRLTTSWGFQSQ